MQIPEEIIPMLTFPVAVFLVVIMWKVAYWLTGKIIPKRYWYWPW